MPLKLTVGLSKKVGLPNYGSLGATCGLEVELPDQVLHADPEAFERQVRDAFAACARRCRTSWIGTGRPQPSHPRTGTAIPKARMMSPTVAMLPTVLGNARPPARRSVPCGPSAAGGAWTWRGWSASGSASTAPRGCRSPRPAA